MHKLYDGDSIGPLLVRLRQARGLSQHQLADKLCRLAEMPTLTRHEVSRWEREERVPARYWLKWLAEALNVSLDTLRAAAAVARGHLPPGDPGSRVVSSWLTLRHDDRETLIALSGVEVDQLRTVLAPTATHPDNNHDGNDVVSDQALPGED